MIPIVKLAAFAIFALFALPVIAHHMAEGIVDEEIYEMIDTMVADTPHGDFSLEDLGSGMTDIDIVTRVQDIEMMVEEGFLDALAQLDGSVTMTIDFTDRQAVTIDILQIEEPEDVEGTDKADGDAETTSFGSLKAEFR
jgi:hypothetical protein